MLLYMSRASRSCSDRFFFEASWGQRGGAHRHTHHQKTSQKCGREGTGAHTRTPARAHAQTCSAQMLGFSWVSWSWPVLVCSWGALGLSWGALGGFLGDVRAVLGRSCAVLGRSWGGLGASWGGLGAVLGGSWGPLGRSKIDPKLDSKTGRIATEKNGSGATPVDVSELEARQRKSDAITQKSYQNRYRYD